MDIFRFKHKSNCKMDMIYTQYIMVYAYMYSEIRA